MAFQLKEEKNVLADFGVRMGVSSASSSVSCAQPPEPSGAAPGQAKAAFDFLVPSTAQDRQMK